MIAFLDIRTMEISREFQNPLEYGAITAICPASHWLIVGTDLGILSLWDLRFGLLLKSWRASGPITACQTHPARGRGRWIMVSTIREDKGPIVEVYDVETAKLMEAFEFSRPSVRAPTPNGDVPARSELIAELAKQESSAAREDDIPASVLSLLVGQGPSSTALDDNDTPKGSSNPSGWAITAGEDRAIRYWDLVKASESFVVTGSPKELDVNFKQSSTTPIEFYTVSNTHRQSTDRQNAINRNQQPLRPHYDAICALGAVETPFSSCIVSGDRSGVIKVWRMEGRK